MRYSLFSVNAYSRLSGFGNIMAVQAVFNPAKDLS